MQRDEGTRRMSMCNFHLLFVSRTEEDETTICVRNRGEIFKRIELMADAPPPRIPSVVAVFFANNAVEQTQELIDNDDNIS